MYKRNQLFVSILVDAQRFCVYFWKQSKEQRQGGFGFGRLGKDRVHTRFLYLWCIYLLYMFVLYRCFTFLLPFYCCTASPSPGLSFSLVRFFSLPCYLCFSILFMLLINWYLRPKLLVQFDFYTYFKLY